MIEHVTKMYNVMFHFLFINHKCIKLSLKVIVKINSFLLFVSSFRFRL